MTQKIWYRHKIYKAITHSTTERDKLLYLEVLIHLSHTQIDQALKISKDIGYLNNMINKFNLIYKKITPYIGNIFKHTQNINNLRKWQTPNP